MRQISRTTVWSGSILLACAAIIEAQILPVNSPSISIDSHHVAFGSQASSVVTGDRSASVDVSVPGRQLNTTVPNVTPPPTGALPNILWLIAEDTVKTNFGAYGNTSVKTPTIDRLATEGIRFDNAFSTAPHCSPSRATLISGAHASVYGTDIHRMPVPVPTGQYFFPKLLRDAGYYTTNNSKTDYNAKPVGTALVQAWSAQGGTATYKNAAGRPFFSVFTNLVSHMDRVTKYQLDKRTVRRIVPSSVVPPPYVPDLPAIRDDYVWHLETSNTLDTWVAKHLSDLKTLGLDGDTIVFFFGDNGGCLPRSKGHKFVTGVGVPLIVYIPPKWQHLTTLPIGVPTSRLVGFEDFAATVLSLAGLDTPSYMTGQAFLGSKAAPPRQYEYSFRSNYETYAIKPARSVFDGRFHYVRSYLPFVPEAVPQSYQWQMPGERAYFDAYAKNLLSPVHRAYYEAQPTEALYDLQADPWELTNLSADPAHATTLARLRAANDAEIRRIRDLGFFPVSTRTQKLPSLYEWVRNTSYPLDALIQAAEIASRGQAADLTTLVGYMSSTKPEIRFWGAAGLATLAQRGLVAQAPAALATLLSDTNAEVRAMAALTLSFLRDPRGLEYLRARAAAGADSDHVMRALYILATHKLESAVLPTIRTVAANPQGSLGKFFARAILVLRGERTVDQLFDPGDIVGGGG